MLEFRHEVDTNLLEETRINSAGFDEVDYSNNLLHYYGTLVVIYDPFGWCPLEGGREQWRLPREAPESATRGVRERHLGRQRAGWGPPGAPESGEVEEGRRYFVHWGYQRAVEVRRCGGVEVWR